MASQSTEEGKVDLKPSASWIQRKLRRWNRLYLPLGLTGVVVAGVIAGWVLSQPAEDAKAPPPPTAPLELVPTLAHGEELQRAGDPRRAMQLYQDAMALRGASSSILVYMMGVCAEQLDDQSKAAELYQQGSQHPSDEIAAACSIRLARIQFQQGRPEDALDTLSRLALVSSRPIYTSTDLGAGLQYVLSLALSAKAAPLERNEFHRDHYFGPEMSFDLDEALALAPREGNQLQLQNRGDDWADLGVRVRGNAREPSITLIEANFTNQPMSVVLELLAAETGWEVSMSETAREIAGAKPLDVFLRDKTASEVLTLILEPPGLAWSFADGALKIQSRDGVPAEQLDRQARSRAVVLLQGALAEAPMHYLAPQAYLALGNIAAHDERFEAAKTRYREAVERFPRRPSIERCMFNLGKSHFRGGDMENATEVFGQVMDNRRGSPLESLAYLYRGRIFFDSGDFKTARMELNRALRFALVPRHEAAASITLAAAYLVENDNAGTAAMANGVLMEHRGSFEEAVFRNQVIYLSALTRFRNVRSNEELRRRTEDLLSASMKVKPETFFGDFGYLLLGRSFSTLNLSDEAVRWFEAGINRQVVAPAMRNHLHFALAEEYRKQNQNVQAVELFDELARSDVPEWSARAATRLADLLYEMQRYDECIAHCRDSVERGFSEADNAVLLRQLGKVYSEMGDHEMAAYCFAGFLPSRPTALAEKRR